MGVNFYARLALQKCHRIHQTGRVQGLGDMLCEAADFLGFEVSHTLPPKFPHSQFRKMKHLGIRLDGPTATILKEDPLVLFGDKSNTPLEVSPQTLGVAGISGV
jgi:hypothetical protein